MTLEKVDVHVAAGPDSRWITIVDGPVTFDLLKIAEVQKLLGSQSVPEGTYTQVRFVISKATVMVDGEEHSASVPSGKLKLIRPFQVYSGEVTIVLLDFEGVSSLQVSDEGGFQLRPKVKLLVPLGTREDKPVKQKPEEKGKAERIAE